ncbi:hypothetical protein [Corynebacterium sp. 335C]
MSITDQRFTAYLEGATAYNNQQSIEDNPHTNPGMRDSWHMGYEQPRDQHRAAQRARRQREG